MVFDVFCKKVQEKFADEHDKKSLSTFIFFAKVWKGFLCHAFFREYIKFVYVYISSLIIEVLHNADYVAMVFYICIKESNAYFPYGACVLRPLK